MEVMESRAFRISSIGTPAAAQGTVRASIRARGSMSNW
jgi:hypothetical protein